MEKRELYIGDQLHLPPGYRFHPTDEELITYYLNNKFSDARFKSPAIGEANLNKCEPWDLPKQAKQGDKVSYFFCARDRKYPTGLRTNRATKAGYWKATGKDKEIFREKLLVGMKKTLVFYTGRAPRGEKTNWVMHEYRMEGNCCINTLHRLAKNEWVICRVFKKSPVGDGFGMGKIASSTKNLPPLMDIQTHVPCFSNAVEGQKAPEEDMSSVLWPMCSTLYEESFMSLFESHGFEEKQGCMKDREMLSFYEETGLGTEINAEIYFDNEIGMNSFEHSVGLMNDSCGGDFDVLF